ncbi:Phosphoribosylaminoimidazole-succinocarboxamide synthase, chloroplastic [Capsicum annuum]|nr:Phosphoribosylaminoimidazole-succinocarboxamide synthase, chloroplastic [Capsicum annuum]
MSSQHQNLVPHVALTNNDQHKEEVMTFIKNSISNCLSETHLHLTVPQLNSKIRGKVRDIYDGGDYLVMVTTDRQSAFDRILASIPFKGQVLNETSLWWFNKTQHITPNAVVSVPDRNVTIAKKCLVFPVEFVGLVKNQKLTENILTPTTKAADHDVPVTPDEIVQRGLMTQADYDEVSRKAMSLFEFGQACNSDPKSPIKSSKALHILNQIRHQFQNKVMRAEAKEVILDQEGVLRIKGWICVPKVGDLTRSIMEEAHCSRYSIHPGAVKMYHDLKQHYWWCGMKRDVAKFVAKCLNCQQVKYEHRRPGGLLQRLPIPEWRWERITMDFVVGLPQTLGKFDSVWRELGTQLNMSTTFHPQIDVQSEQTIQVLEDMLRASVKDFGGHWDQFLSLVEFSYNNSYHSSIQMAPFEALYGRKCRSPVGWFDSFEVRPWGTDLLRDSMDRVRLILDRLLATHSRQKSYADRRVRDLEFMQGERVLLKVSPMKGVMRFGKKGKLSSRFIGPFEILQRVGPVAYELALSPGLSAVHPAFHVSMLKRYDPDDSHMIRWDSVSLDLNLAFEEEPIAILDR